MKTKEILELIKFNKECYNLTKNREFIQNNLKLYKELKFNTSFDKNKKLEVKNLSPWKWLNHKHKWVTEMTEEEYDEEVALWFELNLLHKED